LRAVPDELKRDLALLTDAPHGVAESTVALMSFGARALLEGAGLIAVSAEEPAAIEITEPGRLAMRICLAYLDATEPDWQVRFLEEHSWHESTDEMVERAIKAVRTQRRPEGVVPQEAGSETDKAEDTEAIPSAQLRAQLLRRLRQS
jgi:hypothetical protein